MNKTLLALALSILPVTALSAGELAPALSANPFERPEWLTDAQEIPGGATATTARGRIDLRATLVAGKRSSVNVGGNIVMLGEEVDGYTLISVAEGIAEFSDGDQIIRVTLLTGKERKSAE